MSRSFHTIPTRPISTKLCVSLNNTVWIEVGLDPTQEEIDEAAKKKFIELLTDPAYEPEYETHEEEIMEGWDVPPGDFD